jgi:hypothetical protein
VSRKLLLFEGERARKNQQTREKLQAWAERFYPIQTEAVRAAFQPLIGPWTAITGWPAAPLLERLVSEHVEASRTSLAMVTELSDADEMAGALERTLMRWERERADAMADALVREGMAGHE